jgi:(p)ppGpp synthase/HD superfamily hydrolase
VSALESAWCFEPSFLDRRPMTRIAFKVAAEAHQAQRRDADEVPFIVHPLEVAALLHSFDLDDAVTAAAMLHDTLEDTDLTEAQIASRLDGRVIDLVRTLTNDDRIRDERERKASLRDQVAAAGPDAAFVFAADKLSKVRELRVRLSRYPDAADSPDSGIKLEHYRESVIMLAEALGHHPLVEQLSFELEALESLPPHGRSVG